MTYLVFIYLFRSPIKEKYKEVLSLPVLDVLCVKILVTWVLFLHVFLPLP